MTNSRHQHIGFTPVVIVIPICAGQTVQCAEHRRTGAQIRFAPAITLKRPLLSQAQERGNGANLRRGGLSLRERHQLPGGVLRSLPGPPRAFRIDAIATISLAEVAVDFVEIPLGAPGYASRQQHGIERRDIGHRDAAAGHLKAQHR
jgi:hypothetical protein